MKKFKKNCPINNQVNLRNVTNSEYVFVTRFHMTFKNFPGD